jgi:quercetin dioxygenase-like cupin family protein
VTTDTGPGRAASGLEAKHNIGDLAEVLDNLGVFGMLAGDLVAPCRSGFRRVPISQGADYYLSLQGFTANQIAYAHTHPDSEEWVIVLNGGGQALVADSPVTLARGLIIGRAAAHPHGFLSGDDALLLLSVQLPRPSEGTTTWDQPGETTEPIDCAVTGTCRRCWRCGGHSLNVRADVFLCENCNLGFEGPRSRSGSPTR